MVQVCSAPTAAPLHTRRAPPVLASPCARAGTNALSVRSASEGVNAGASRRTREGARACMHSRRSSSTWSNICPEAVAGSHGCSVLLRRLHR
eukprot:4045352-Pleurochrysis_carterae.AAC.1